MYQTLRQIIHVGIKTEPPPAPASERRRSRSACTSDILRIARARAHDPARRRGILQRAASSSPTRLSNPYYNIEGLGITLRRESAPCRCADGDRTGVEAHGDRA